jgi:hypothetical protein
VPDAAHDAIATWVSPCDGGKGAVRGASTPRSIFLATRKDLFRRPDLNPSLSTLVDDGALYHAAQRDYIDPSPMRDAADLRMS